MRRVCSSERVSATGYVRRTGAPVSSLHSAPRAAFAVAMLTLVRCHFASRRCTLGACLVGPSASGVLTAGTDQGRTEHGRLADPQRECPVLTGARFEHDVWSSRISATHSASLSRSSQDRRELTSHSKCGDCKYLDAQQRGRQVRPVEPGRISAPRRAQASQPHVVVLCSMAVGTPHGSMNQC